jgi:uncharacterized lipoprotein
MQVPPGSTVKTGENYYPVPASSAATMQKPSLVPPGSKMSETEPQLKPLTTQGPAATQQTMQTKVTDSGKQALALNYDLNRSWLLVGKALRAAGYRILDQDKSVASYYIFDIRSKGQAISRTTPIYRVHLQTVGTATQVTVLTQTNTAAPKAVAAAILGQIEAKLH